ncbi:MAG TPA: ceramidase domain-containing protein [Chitinophagales bacterium]|nr:ceramidase domain-containing protein [Chitinophagales bacterium]
MKLTRRSVKWQILKTRLYIEHLRARAFYLPGFIFVLTSLSLVIYYSLHQFNDLWGNWSLANGNTFHFCEANRMGQLIRQPANTWSNLGYLLVGLFALTLGIQDYKRSERKASDNFLVRHPLFSILFGVSALYLFTGSFLYHASLTRFFQKLDQAGLYSMVVMVLTFNLYKIFPLVRIKGKWKSSHAFMVALAMGLNVFLFIKLGAININLLFPTLIVIIMLTSLYYLLFVNREHYFTNYLWAALATMVLAGVIWILDRTNMVCSPTSIFQGHAAWHLLTAASILFIYMYYRSGTVPVAEIIAVRDERRALRRMRRGRM